MDLNPAHVSPASAGSKVIVGRIMDGGDASPTARQPVNDELVATGRQVQHIHVETCCGYNEAVEREVCVPIPPAPPPPRSLLPVSLSHLLCITAERAHRCTAATLRVMTQVALLSPFIQCKVLQTGLGLTANKPVHLPKQARFARMFSWRFVSCW